MMVDDFSDNKGKKEGGNHVAREMSKLREIRRWWTTATTGWRGIML